MTEDNKTIAAFNASARDFLPDLIGIRFSAAGDGWLEAELSIRKQLMAPNGFLHAGAIVTLADSCSGLG